MRAALGIVAVVIGLVLGCRIVTNLIEYGVLYSPPDPGGPLHPVTSFLVIFLSIWTIITGFRLFADKD